MTITQNTRGQGNKKNIRSIKGKYCTSIMRSTANNYTIKSLEKKNNVVAGAGSLS